MDSHPRHQPAFAWNLKQKKNGSNNGQRLNEKGLKVQIKTGQRATLNQGGWRGISDTVLCLIQ